MVTQTLLYATGEPNSLERVETKEKEKEGTSTLEILKPVAIAPCLELGLQLLAMLSPNGPQQNHSLLILERS